MDISPGVGSIVLRASLIMEKAVASLRMTTMKGNQEARDGCVRCLALLDLLHPTDSADSQNDGLHTTKRPHLLQLVTAAATIENILSELSEVEIKRQERRDQIEKINHSPEKEFSGPLMPEANVSVSVYKVEPRIPISFKDVVGNYEAKQALYENVVLPLTISDETKVRVFSGIRAGSGNVMLYGPAGTGKTIMCQAAAFEAKAELIIVRPSDVLSKYHGESERFLRGVFEKARAFPRAVIFFDEFDAIAATRGGMEEGMSSRRLLSELLLQLTEQKQIQSQESKVLALKLASRSPSVGGIYIGKLSQSRKRQVDREAEDSDNGTFSSREASHWKRRRWVSSFNSTPRASEPLLGVEESSHQIPGGRSNICVDIEAERCDLSGMPYPPPSRCKRVSEGTVDDCVESEDEREEEVEEEEQSEGRGLVVIAATNRLEDLDPAVVRRFESRVYVGVPEHDTRVAMVIAFLSGLDTVLSVEDLHTISRSTAGWSGSEIETLCREAAMAPVRAVWGYSPSPRTLSDSQHQQSQSPMPMRTDSGVTLTPALALLHPAVSDERVADTDPNSNGIRPIELNDFLAGIDMMMKRGSDMDDIVS